jgi:orotidine-5'-phosphate decarboxylase
MLVAAAEASAGRVALVAVTVLTSHDIASFAQVTGRQVVDLGAEVERLAQLAMNAGMQGIVCSAAELLRVKPIVGKGRLVVPGIRRAGDPTGDQQRIATPEAARVAGATHLVVGRADFPSLSRDLFRTQ